MAEAENSATPEFWDVRYRAEKMPWDLGAAPAELRIFLAQTSGRGRALLPGCGSAYEVKAFHDAGFDVTALDFSKAAVGRARHVLGALRNKVVQGDFFTHYFAERFDLIYERAFLCSLPPAERSHYAARMTELLRPGGSLIGIFLYGEELDPPPYPITDEEMTELLGENFSRVRSEPVRDSLPLFQGMERWEEWCRKET